MTDACSPKAFPDGGFSALHDAAFAGLEPRMVRPILMCVAEPCCVEMYPQGVTGRQDSGLRVVCGHDSHDGCYAFDRLAFARAAAFHTVSQRQATLG